jgi:branched-chain amino acid transport system substrate-binding protein
MSNRTRMFPAFFVMAMAFALVVGCAGAPPAAPAGGEEAPEEAPMEDIKVGAIFDLSGATSDVGTPYAEGVKDYVTWLNSEGGVNGHQIDLISQDYGYAVDQAEQLYSQYVNQENVQAFMGWGTGDTEALRSRIAADKIPFMSASYSANLANIEEAPYNFLVGTTYSDQMIIALRWALDDWLAKGNEGTPNVAVLHHDSPFGQSPVDSYGPDGTEFANENDIGFTAIAMPGGATDLTPQLTQVQNFGANYIIIQNVSSPAALLVQDAQRLGMEDVQIICLNWCADENLVNLAGGAAEGVVGTLPFAPTTADVPGLAEPRQYAESQGKDLDEIGLHYSQGWWTMAVMTEGIRRTLEEGNEATGENIRAGLETLDNFSTGGVTAPVDFKPDDHRGTRSLRLYQVVDGQWQELTDFISATSD